MAAILNAYYTEPGGGIALQQQHEAIRRAIRAGDEQKAARPCAGISTTSPRLAQLAGPPGGAAGLHRPQQHPGIGPRHISDRVKRPSAPCGKAVWRWCWSRPASPAMRPFLQQLGLMTPMIACDGALLWNVQAGAGSARVSLPPDLAAEIVAAVETWGCGQRGERR